MSEQRFHFQRALVGDQWQNDVCVAVGADGLISGIEPAVPPREGDQRLAGIAIPGMVNVHSHAFQRAFAGLSEFRTAERDSFWTWRKLMYDFVSRLSPADMYATAKGLYSELVRNGYTWVGEFHYVHNTETGQPYADPAELSDAVIRAAVDVGLGICHLPVLYQRGGFRDEPLTAAQRRFSLSEDSFLDLVSRLKSRWKDEPGVRIGMAFHSLRAVAGDTLKRVSTAYRAMEADGAIHIHVAEQAAEVDECLAVTGARPVQWLLENVGPDERWCLIHATHLVEEEIGQLAGTGAVVGLCPTTEANLGDGIFPAPEFLQAGGRISIGSDSHVCTNPRAELRLLEYAQRLVRQQRAILGTSDVSVGRRLYEAAAAGGASALRINTGNITVGSRADIVVLDPAHPTIGQVDPDRILDRYVFCDAGNPVLRTLVGGQTTSGEPG